jgi:hypothetical protein
MNREDIVRMAREAGLVNWEATAYANELERFAKLVAQHEREACAKVCDDLDKMRGYSYADKCATAIRARGQA